MVLHIVKLAAKETAGEKNFGLSLKVCLCLVEPGSGTTLCLYLGGPRKKAGYGAPSTSRDHGYTSIYQFVVIYCLA